MNLIELSLANGRRIGLPPLSAVLIAELEEGAEDDAKTVIRWHIMGGPASIANVKDSFRQVLNLFPKSSGGLGWTHGTIPSGAAIAFPEGTIASYEELGDEDGIFRLTLGCATGPLTVDVKASFEDVQAMLGNTAPPKRAAPPRPPRAKPAVPRAARGGKGKAK
jgi:hypothetical protein